MVSVQIFLSLCVAQYPEFFMIYMVNKSLDALCLIFFFLNSDYMLYIGLNTVWILRLSWKHISRKPMVMYIILRIGFLSIMWMSQDGEITFNVVRRSKDEDCESFTSRERMNGFIFHVEFQYSFCASWNSGRDRNESSKKN
jgi:hypothetical protein